MTERPGDNHVTGAVLMFAAVSCLPFNDALAKHLSAFYPVLLIVWARFVSHFLILLPIVLLRYGPAALWPRRPAMQTLRGFVLLLSTGFFFTAVSLIPLTDAIALLLTSPILLTALSPLMLGEHVGARRWVAVLIGFAGAMILIRPGFGGLDTGSIMALGASVSLAFYNVLTRKISGTAPPLVTLAFTAVVGMVVTSLFVPFQWVTPDIAHIPLFLGTGVFAASGHFLLIRSFEYAPASILAPFLYTELIAATAIGYFWFDDFPDVWTWTGVAVIVGSGIYISFRERKKTMGAGEHNP